MAGLVRLVPAITRAGVSIPLRRAPTGAMCRRRNTPPLFGITPQRPCSRGLHEPVVERVAGAAHGADRVGGAAAVERLAQAPDMDVDGALVDIGVAIRRGRASRGAAGCSLALLR
jgi:hypothetical protein